MSSAIRFLPTALPEVVEIHPQVHRDERGFFFESWNLATFTEGGITGQFVQDNHSLSHQGILRGLHYQIRRTQGKLVRVTRGEVFDVAVDLRRSSACFGQWVGIWLSAAKHNMLWIPPGFAHGFYVTTPVAELIYKCTELYSPEDERTVRWDDPQLAIDWPLLEGRPPSLSARDATAAKLAEAECFP